MHLSSKFLVRICAKVKRIRSTMCMCEKRGGGLTGNICTACRQHSYASSGLRFLEKEADIDIISKKQMKYKTIYPRSAVNVYIYLTSASADIPAHGNASEGSMLLARSNACWASFLSPSCL